jgi:hypothetical protein
MVKAPGILFVMAFYGLESGLPVKDRSLRQLLHKAPVGAAAGCDLLIFVSARFVAWALQPEFLFAFDLDHLGVVHGDFHCAKTQIAQGALDLTQNGCFVLAVNAT